MKSMTLNQQRTNPLATATATTILIAVRGIATIRKPSAATAATKIITIIAATTTMSSAKAAARTKNTTVSAAATAPVTTITKQ